MVDYKTPNKQFNAKKYGVLWNVVLRTESLYKGKHNLYINLKIFSVHTL